jgi:uncharacterized protein
MDLSFYVAAIPAVVLLGLSKGGFSGVGMLATPLVALVISPVEAAAILLPILVVQDMISVIAYRATWDRWNLLVLLAGALPGVFLAYLLAARVSESAVELAVGLISIVFAARRLVIDRRGQGELTAKPNMLIGWLCGAASGFTSMIAHAGTPPFQIFVIPQRLPQNIFVGTSVMFFATVNLLKVLLYFMLGQFSAKNLIVSTTLLPLAVLSTWLGIYIVRRTSSSRFITIIYILMVLVGGKLVFNGLSDLAAGGV